MRNIKGKYKMIDYIKIQTKFMKDLDNEKTSKFIRCCYDNGDYLISNMYIAYRIPENRFYLDSVIMEEMKMLPVMMSSVIIGDEWFLTGNITKYSDIGNKIAYEFIDIKKHFMYIDKKLFDTINFKTGDNFQFFAESNKSVMRILQYGKCVCMVMPVQIKGK